VCTLRAQVHAFRVGSGSFDPQICQEIAALVGRARRSIVLGAGTGLGPGLSLDTL